MYKLKQNPEDFFVKEISAIKLEKDGKYAYFLLKKRDYTTLKAVETVARALGLPSKSLGFAGNKDRIAITEQVCSAKNASKEKIEKTSLKDIELTFLGKGNKPVSLGDLEGNYFEIVVRNLEEGEKPEKKTTFVNFFGEQRFSKQNADIGKAIVKRDFKKAAELFAQSNPKVKDFLEKNPSDFVNAIRQLPLKLLRLLVNSYQSLLWNNLAKELSEKTKENMRIPLIGFGTEETEQVKSILTEEKLTTRDFVIKEFPELSSEGSERELFADARELDIGKFEDDELNAGKKKLLLKFILPKGSYATEFIRQIFSQSN